MEIRIVLRGALHSGATVLDFHQLPWRRDAQDQGHPAHGERLG
ncbi:MAG TPA: hypothetical protein VLW50_01815 [Streptosporangiaceae bacterium]|nr:hypothetical protein [Streptosporangiaceae bacterium]